MNVEIETTEIYKNINGQFEYTMKWSNNPYIFIISNDDWYIVAEVKQKLENRLNSYLNDRANQKQGIVFKTSDIKGLEYLKV